MYVVSYLLSFTVYLVRLDSIQLTISIKSINLDCSGLIVLDRSGSLQTLLTEDARDSINRTRVSKHEVFRATI